MLQWWKPAALATGRRNEPQVKTSLGNNEGMRETEREREREEIREEGREGEGRKKEEEEYRRHTIQVALITLWCFP